MWFYDHFETRLIVILKRLDVKHPGRKQMRSLDIFGLVQRDENGDLASSRYEFIRNFKGSNSSSLPLGLLTSAEW